MKNYRFYLTDIYEAMGATQAFVEGMDFDAFISDDKTASAVIRKLGIIGESMMNVPDTIQEKYPQVPWKQMAGMRDKFIQTYFDIDTHMFGILLKI